MHKECLLTIAQAYVAWALQGCELPTMPHVVRRAVAGYYAAIEGRPHAS